jgi:hypothetical protein
MVKRVRVGLLIHGFPAARFTLDDPKNRSWTRPMGRLIV